VETPLLNPIWPKPRRRDVGAAGTLGRVIHWLSVIAAGVCALMALEFAIEGWAIGLSRALVVVALVLMFGSRALLYALARE
jgi:ABC-type Na+ efflux pump permease subunit